MQIGIFLGALIDFAVPALSPQTSAPPKRARQDLPLFCGPEPFSKPNRLFMTMQVHHSFKSLALAAALALPLFSAPASAASLVENASTCLADNTNGKDRKDLARWIFLAMASHPDIKSLSAATPEAADQASRTAGALFTRLLAENCANELRALAKAEGPGAMKKAFEFLGQLAMQELMSNREVAGNLTAFERYVDVNRITQALTPEK